MERITPNVFVEDRYSLSDTYRGCNYGYVQTTAGIVLIDTPMLPTDAVVFRNEIRDRGEIRYIVNTHSHIDHIAGDFFFPGRVVAHDYASAQFAAPIEEMSTSARIDEAVAPGTAFEDYLRMVVDGIDPGDVPLLDGYRLEPPEISFTDSLTLAVGDHTFELLHVPGHTPGDIGVYVPQEDVYFAGDGITTGEYPNLSQSRPFEWIESLVRIEALDADVVVPGHGPVGGPDTPREFRRFLETCIETVEEAIERGLDRSEAAERISFEDLRPALHSGPERGRLDVERLYDAVTGR